MSECPLRKSALQFGAFTFCARPHESDLCGSNGLPLTPNSITIYGRSQVLKTLKHPNLCQYLDIIRSKHERIIVVSEVWGCMLDKIDKERKKSLEYEEITYITYQILKALNFLHEKNIFHRLSPENITIDLKNSVKLFNYGFFYMTGYGKYVSFPIGTLKYMAPEILLAGHNGTVLGSKSDIWSLGIILAELLLQCSIWPSLKLTQLTLKILSLLECSGSLFERIAREHNCLEIFQNLPEEIVQLVDSCLQIMATKRSNTEKLLNLPLFEKFTTIEDDKSNNKQLHIPFTLNELYYWWQLAGGDVYTELKNEGLILSKPPILNIPKIVLLEGAAYGKQRKDEESLDSRIIPINLETLYKRLEHISVASYYPLIHCTSEIIKNNNPEPYNVSKLPLIIKERDPEYQFHRVILFERLLKGYPSTRDLIIKEAEINIPPLKRGDIWAALLNVRGPYQNIYTRIDKETPISTDRQIEVDIPRCHQYNELLSSGEGHKKLKRILKAWVVSNPEYVYWQGLDSLTAPFLYLNFNNEAKAFACLSAFIPKYLHRFFLKDNSVVIQEYLAKFSQLIAFHEPVLANHLCSINFIPELFAIPWFLTMFSHVFPLHKILHLWDRLLIGSASFPLFAGLSVLQRLRDTLLVSGFNECILLFSDLPELDMELCVARSVHMHATTPPSITLRKHQNGGFAATSELDILNILLSDLQKEFCPRISASDVINLLKNKTNQIVIIDIRTPGQYSRAAVPGSINIPFSQINLNNPNINAVGHNLIKYTESSLKNIVVVASEHEEAIQASKYLVQCGIQRVCILHGGINILYSVTPSILIAQNA